MKELRRELFKIFAIVFPLAMVLTFLIQLKWHSSSIIDWPNLYGLFYPVTSDAIGYTFNFEYYIKGLVIHLVIFGLVGYFLVNVLDTKLKIKILRKILIIVVWIGFIIVVLPRIIIVQDADFKWDYDKTTKIDEKTLN
ncbi:hypothetical protein ACUNWD_17975 [Sunxiuqinia sp. A32]|uniref:hypothetical protein n=1 Tax=Sunxiuqinia sp. A32 TaxID=3461496 RepID=UPI00404561FE